MGFVRLLPTVAALCYAALLLSPAESGGLLRGKRVVGSSKCANQVLAEVYRYRSLRARSKMECVAQCRLDESCKSIVFDEDSRLCQLGSSKADNKCSKMEPAASSSLSFYQEAPPCGKGEEMGPMGLCICADGFMGRPCKRYFRDCHDIRKHDKKNWKNDAVHTIQPLRNFPPFQVFCRDVSSRIRTFIADRRSTEENFDRSWDDYRNGFGEVDSDHWLGLDKIHALTAARPQELKVNLKGYDDKPLIISILNFEVSDLDSGYKLYFNGSSEGNAVDACIKPLFGVKFSTHDHDRDNEGSINCAAVRKGGFWYKGKKCNTCNPFGILYRPTSHTIQGLMDEAFWESVLNTSALFKVGMYVLPILP